MNRYRFVGHPSSGSQVLIDAEVPSLIVTGSLLLVIVLTSKLILEMSFTTTRSVLIILFQLHEEDPSLYDSYSKDDAVTTDLW